jgi:hypothetical protein
VEWTIEGLSREPGRGNRYSIYTRATRLIELPAESQHLDEMRTRWIRLPGYLWIGGTGDYSTVYQNREKAKQGGGRRRRNIRNAPETGGHVQVSGMWQSGMWHVALVVDRRTAVAKRRGRQTVILACQSLKASAWIELFS